MSEASYPKVMKVVYFFAILLSSFPGTFAKLYIAVSNSYQIRIIPHIVPLLHLAGGVNSISISPEGEVLVVEGSTLRLTCTPESTGQLLGVIRLYEVQEGNMMVDLQVPFESDTVNHVVIYSFGPVTRQQSGTALICRNTFLATSSKKAILNVASELILLCGL